MARALTLIGSSAVFALIGLAAAGLEYGHRYSPVETALGGGVIGFVLAFFALPVNRFDEPPPPRD